MIIRNWRDVHPVIAHQAGIDWRLLSLEGSEKTDGDIDVDQDPKFACLKSITYVSLAWLQPGLSYEPHTHSDHEEIYYIVKGQGKIRVDDETSAFKQGDIIYVPPFAAHEIKNDCDEMVEFLAFGGVVKP
jgi:oxalate decarboxylase/phosphoglucose isomerase-like protein (cupin superfamily)